MNSKPMTTTVVAQWRGRTGRVVAKLERVSMVDASLRLRMYTSDGKRERFTDVEMSNDEACAWAESHLTAPSLLNARIERP